MDVTRENFAELLPLIIQSIQEADFIGFDTEFSGIIHSILMIYRIERGVRR